MRIQLDDNYILVSEEYCCWIARLVKSEKGKLYERRVSGYYRTFPEAVISYIDKKINSSEATTLKELTKEIKSLKTEVRAWKPKQ